MCVPPALEKVACCCATPATKLSTERALLDQLLLTSIVTLGTVKLAPVSGRSPTRAPLAESKLQLMRLNARYATPTLMRSA
jgi:hypothetical protein